MSSDGKELLHHLISQKLIMAPVGITSDLETAKAGEMMTLLDLLLKGKMKAADAHTIAQLHAGLPGILTEVGQKDLARFAEEVLADLRGRKDEVKPEQVTEPTTGQSRLDHDQPPLRGN